ncbi:expressed unknown protein [Seminavis robusta]|uniref:Uncharacterized protein n=1 Tax=Seminavis robusta TaxID=568900 RepID=A0A9N8H6K6_9STRA|nr:expressed unknown protein [Seminavis robusta]|eukprot:Sro149_g068700.1 n/a (304) ;mRNA; f:97579-98490
MFWAFLSRLFHIAQGRLVYLLALLDIPIGYFEKQRFQLRRLPHPRNNNDNHENTKKVLLISFAGSTFLVGGFPRAEFQTVLEKAAERCGVAADCLFLVDPSVTFYTKSSSHAQRRSKRFGTWEGWDEVVEDINQLIAAEGYDKVVAVGSSMGATAILALVGRFRRCDTAVVFNPLVDLVHESRLGFYVGGLRLPPHIRHNLPDIMAEQCLASSRRGTNVMVHYSQHSPKDIVQLQYLQDAIRARQEKTDRERDDNILDTIGHDTSKHVLARELKKRQELLPLLEDALRKTLLLREQDDKKTKQ